METAEVIPKTKWTIDHAHSEIGFEASHLLMGNVKGVFKTFDARIYTNAEDFRTAEVDFWIDTSSITTGNVKRDIHLKSRDFFNIKKHKQIAFKSSALIKSFGYGNYELCGELTIMGVTNSVKVNVHFGGMLKDTWGNERIGFTVTGKINRSEWGLIWNAPTESGALLVSDEVAISCEVELTKKCQKCMTMQMEPAFEEEDYA